MYSHRVSNRGLVDDYLHHGPRLLLRSRRDVSKHRRHGLFPLPARLGTRLAGLGTRERDTERCEILISLLRCPGNGSQRIDHEVIPMHVMKTWCGGGKEPRIQVTQSDSIFWGVIILVIVRTDVHNEHVSNSEWLPRCSCLNLQTKTHCKW